MVFIFGFFLTPLIEQLPSVFCSSGSPSLQDRLGWFGLTGVLSLIYQQEEGLAKGREERDI